MHSSLFLILGKFQKSSTEHVASWAVVVDLRDQVSNLHTGIVLSANRPTVYALKNGLEFKNTYRSFRY